MELNVSTGTEEQCSKRRAGLYICTEKNIKTVAQIAWEEKEKHDKSQHWCSCDRILGKLQLLKRLIWPGLVQFAYKLVGKTSKVLYKKMHDRDFHDCCITKDGTSTDT